MSVRVGADNSRAQIHTAGMQVSCSCTIQIISLTLSLSLPSSLSHTHMNTHFFSLLPTSCYLTWPCCRTKRRCQRQCSCCNVGQAIYKTSSRVQAPGAGGGSQGETGGDGGRRRGREDKKRAHRPETGRRRGQTALGQRKQGAETEQCRGKNEGRVGKGLRGSCQVPGT